MKKSDRRGALFGFFPAIIHPEANVENPRMCSAMTLTCWLQLVFVVYLLTIHDAPETEVWRPGVEFVAGLIATMFLIPAVKGVGRRFGAFFVARSASFSPLRDRGACVVVREVCVQPFERVWLYAVGLLWRATRRAALHPPRTARSLSRSRARALARACCSQSQSVPLSLSHCAPLPLLVNSNTLYVMLRTIGSMFGTAAKLKKARNLRKFSDQGWQLAVHASFAVSKKNLC